MPAQHEQAPAAFKFTNTALQAQSALQAAVPAMHGAAEGKDVGTGAAQATPTAIDVATVAPHQAPIVAAGTTSAAVPQPAPVPNTTGASRERLLSTLAGSRTAASPDRLQQQQNGVATRQPGGSLAGLLQQPLEETYFTVTDRRVRKQTEPASLYSMCRQWVQNDPDVDSEPPPPPVAAVALPEPLPALPPMPLPEEVPLIDDGTLFQDEDTLPIELLLEHHKEHWQTIRQHKKVERERDLERFEHRLAALVPSLAPASDDGATLTPMDIADE